MQRAVTVKRYTDFADMKRDEYRWAQSQPPNTRFVDTLHWTLVNLRAEIKQRHYIDLIAKLEKYTVKYLIVGGFAVSYYSQPRVTPDLDIWIEASDESVDAPVAGMEPIRVNVLTTLPGVIFADAWERRVAAGIEGTELSAYYISREDLIAAKLASGRLRDLADVDEMREASEAQILEIPTTTTQEEERTATLNPELQKKLEQLQRTIEMFTETQAVRAKYGQGDDERSELSQEMSMLRVQLHNLEKEVYGSSLRAMQVRAENLERALHGQGAKQ